jgi:dynein assembly factor 2
MTSKKSPTDSKDPGADVLKSVLRASKANNNSEQLNLTREERDRIEKALDKKEFRDLMANYVDEISDPKHKAEQDEYLRQLESQNEVPEGKKIIRPLPGFVLQFKHFKSSDNSIRKKGLGKNISRSTNPKKKDKRSKKAKLIVNIVYSKEIKSPSCSTQNKNANGKGRQWTLPYFFGPLRMEPDNEKILLATFDCCFHPNALVYASKHIPFRDLIAQTAREGAAKRFASMNEKMQIDPNYLLLKGVSYRNGSPSVLVISESSDLLSQPSEDDCDNKKTPPNNDDNVAINDESCSRECDEMESNTKTNFGNGFKKGFLVEKRSIPSKDLGNISNVKKNDNSEIVPHYEVIEQGEFDMTDHTTDPSLHSKSNRPKHLIYRISLVGMCSTKNVDLDVSEERLILKSIQTEQKESSRNYHLNVKLPYPVKFTDGSATFDKRKSTLIVTLPVCKPDDNPCLKQSMSIEENYDGHEASAISACNQHETANENDDDDHDNSECFHEDNSTLSISSDNSIVIVNRKKDLHSRWLDNEHADKTVRESFARDTKIPVQNCSRKNVNNDDENIQYKSDGSVNKKYLSARENGRDDDDFELINIDCESSQKSSCLKNARDNTEDIALQRYLNNHTDEEDSLNDVRGNMLFALD